VWGASRFEALERYIRETLDSPGRIRLKLLNPLGVGIALTDRHTRAVKERASLLKDDFATLDEVEGQLAVYQADLMRDFGFRISDIDRILLEMEKRGHEFFDDTMRIGRVMDLLNRSRVQQGFEQHVVGEAPREIERKVSELVDWLVDADLRQWQDVTRHLAERRRQYRDRIVGDSDSGRFLSDHSRLLEAVNRESQKVIDSFDRRKEARELADDARNAVAAAAAVSAGGVGLGAIVTIAATTAAADVTGIIMASVIAALGFFILPAKRERAKEHAGHAGQQCERQKDDDWCDRRTDDRDRDLRDRFLHRLDARLSVEKVSVNILDDDDRVVDHQSDRCGDASQCHEVE